MNTIALICLLVMPTQVTVDASFTGSAMILPEEYADAIKPGANGKDYTYKEYVQWMVDKAPTNKPELRSAMWAYACEYRFLQWGYTQQPLHNRPAYALRAKKKLALQYEFTINQNPMTVKRWYEIVTTKNLHVGKPALLDEVNKADPPMGNLANPPLIP